MRGFELQMDYDYQYKSACAVVQVIGEEIHRVRCIERRQRPGRPVEQKPFARIYESSSVGARPSSAAPVK